MAVLAFNPEDYNIEVHEINDEVGIYYVGRVSEIPGLYSAGTERTGVYQELIEQIINTKKFYDGRGWNDLPSPIY